MNNPVVLMYHDIVTIDDKSSGFQNESAFQYKLLASDFEEQVKSLADKNVTFTFDDGGVSFITQAAPILERYGRKGIFFISTDYIDTPGFLTTEQVKELDTRGHIIGSHSCSHPHDISQLSEEEIFREWTDSKRRLEEILGHEVVTASIPNGYCTKMVCDKAFESGLRVLYTSKPTTRSKKHNNIQCIGRYVVHCDMAVNHVHAIVCNHKTRIKIYLRWLVLEALKMMLGSRYDKLKSHFA